MRFHDAVWMSYGFRSVCALDKDTTVQTVPVIFSQNSIQTLAELVAQPAISLNKFYSIKVSMQIYIYVRKALNQHESDEWWCQQLSYHRSVSVWASKRAASARCGSTSPMRRSQIPQWRSGASDSGWRRNCCRERFAEIRVPSWIHDGVDNWSREFT